MQRQRIKVEINIWDVVVHTVVTVLLLVFVGIVPSVKAFAGAASTMTTTYELPYVPARIEMVQDVTNVLLEKVAWGGAGGVGLPQVDRSLQAYEQHERDVVHYAVVKSDSYHHQTWLHYFDLEPSAVFHTSVGPYNSPTFHKWGSDWGYYEMKTASIEGRTLSIERELVADPSVPFVLFFLGGFGAILLYLAWLRPLVDSYAIRPIRKIIRRRFR